ncbi:MAG TPA: helix-turn-helix domain-containing protein [Solirubrobacterales bacterium]|nr:helix-turn-helix domain-containing protein [Solirubrobacterales bacterium]
MLHAVTQQRCRKLPRGFYRQDYESIAEPCIDRPSLTSPYFGRSSNRFASPFKFDLLAMLASEPGRLFTKDELLFKVWGHPEGASTRTIDSRVSSIRCKLRRAGVEGFIVNYRGWGYKLCEGVSIKP